MTFLAWPSGRVQRVLVSTQKAIMELTWLGFFLLNVLAYLASNQPHPGFRGPSQPFLARSSRVMWWRTLTESWCFALLGSRLAQILGQMVSIGVKALSNANLGASKHVKRKKSWLPADVRRSKTPLLQPATHSFLCTYQCYAGAGERQGMGIWLFSKICNQIPCPRAKHSSQMQPNFPTPGCTLHCCPSQGWTQERHNKNISK